MDIDTLMKIGFGKSEVAIYLALLKLGKSTTTDLTKETGIHRSYIYDILEKLKEKGLVSQTKEENKFYFDAASPIRIKEHLSERMKEIEALLPELTKLQEKTKEKINVEIFKGKEGIKTILNDLLREKKDYYALGTLKKFEEILPIFSEQFLLKANKLKLKEKVILQEEEEIIRAKTHEYKYLPKEYFFLSSIVIYGNKVALFVWDDPYVQILIENKAISSSYLTQFNALWKIAKK